MKQLNRRAGLWAGMLGLVVATALASPDAALAQRSRCIVREVSVSPPDAQVQVESTAPVLATAYDPAGNPCDNVTYVWTSNNVQVATVNRSGIVMGVSPGVAIITVRTGVGAAAKVGRSVVTVVAAALKITIPRPIRLGPSASQASSDTILSGGFPMPAWTGTGGTSALEYVRTFVVRLDSAARALRSLLSNASGLPATGATDPQRLTAREKQQWRRCRALKEDLQTFLDNIPHVQDGLQDNALKNAWAFLGEQFGGLQSALQNCETVAFMIESPEHYTPWRVNYESFARALYGDWYPRLRAVHEANRTVAGLLNSQLPADRRLPPIPSLPTAPRPTGAAP
ncbi:MAG: Ig domain-containing protein [Candidatus Binatia bacterium]